MDADVLVIGAGAAGLAAARELSGRGLSIAVLEARPRLGGRIWTIRDPMAALPIEMGAEFIHGRSPEIWDIVPAARLAAFDAGGERWCSRGGVIERCDGEMGGVQAIIDGMQDAASPDRSFQDYLDNRDDPDEIKRLAAAYIEGFDAADKRRVSVAWLAAEESASKAIGGGRGYRLPGGYDRIIGWLRAGINPARSDFRLSAPVEAVEWKRGSVAAWTPRGRVTAARAVLTLPLGVLQSGSVHFMPEPVQSIGAARAIEMGPALRVVLRFRRGLDDWRPDLAGAGFMHTDHPFFPTWWTPLPARAPVLTAWSAGPYASGLQNRSAEEIAAIALDAVPAIFGVDRAAASRDFESAHVHDWGADAYSRGGYAWVPAGAANAPAALAEPVEDTLFFAGEAVTPGGHTGTVHGAIASGSRAAARIFHSIGYSKK